MRRVLITFAALSLVAAAPVSRAAPPKDALAKAKRHDLYVLPLKIDAVTFVSPWTPCAPLPGYAPVPGSGNLLGIDAGSVGFCGIASVRLKKTSPTATLAGRTVTIQVVPLRPWLGPDHLPLTRTVSPTSMTVRSSPTTSGPA